jgi:hypothetical protein
MHVRNVHRRTTGSPEELDTLLGALASDTDELWPGDRWPRMRLDGLLALGAQGGHGPIRYRVESCQRSHSVRFRFERPRGCDGVHEFTVVVDGEALAQLVHVLEARMSGLALLSWPLVFRPLHDALIEDALDNAERHVTGQLQRPARWSTYVRGLRFGLAILAATQGPHGRQNDNTRPPHTASLSRDPVLRVARTLPVAFVLHDLEEVLAATWWTRHGATVLTCAHPWLPPAIVKVATRTTTPQMAVATCIVGLGVAAVAATAQVGRRERPLRAATFVLAAHGITHLTSAIAVRSYTPGAATAALVVLPWGSWALRLLRESDRRDDSTRRRDTAVAAVSTIVAAIAGHAVGRRVAREKKPGD